MSELYKAALNIIFFIREKLNFIKSMKCFTTSNINLIDMLQRICGTSFHSESLTRSETIQNRSPILFSILHSKSFLNAFTGHCSTCAVYAMLVLDMPNNDEIVIRGTSQIVRQCCLLHSMHSPVTSVLLMPCCCETCS